MIGGCMVVVNNVILVNRVVRCDFESVVWMVGVFGGVVNVLFVVDVEFCLRICVKMVYNVVVRIVRIVLLMICCCDFGIVILINWLIIDSLVKMRIVISGVVMNR